MTPIADTASLAAFRERLRGVDTITVDTEFMRDKTYWPVLCLVQIAGPDEAALIDPLAEGIDLAPLFDLMADESVLKVFHAARQDVEIFVHLAGAVPVPMFDTQVAAMVCGFGDSVGYETLVNKLAGARIDKSARFTDWAARPLSEKARSYALSDVTHLRVVYGKLAERLDRTDRAGWLEEEMAVLTDPATYVTQPEDAWKRVKARSTDRRFLELVRRLAAWRETAAQSRDLPRNRLMRDETLLDICAHPPKDAAQLTRARGMSKGTAEGKLGGEILAAVAAALEIPDDALPVAERREELPSGIAPAVDLLKVLLKMTGEHHDVAQKLIATQSDLEQLVAYPDQPHAVLKGWRGAVFGDDALALLRGELALTMAGRRVAMLASDGAVLREVGPPAKPPKPGGGRRRGGKRRRGGGNGGETGGPPAETAAD